MSVISNVTHIKSYKRYMRFSFLDKYSSSKRRTDLKFVDKSNDKVGDEARCID